MKRLLLLSALGIFIAQLAYAQLPNGATAPNWTLTDLNGQSHTMYDYLDQEKVVFLDFSATWCGPCWNYHNSHAFADLYDQYGPSGTNNIMAFMIEEDSDTEEACLYGSAGCTGGTLGNWVNGTPYPIIDDATESLRGPYQINYYPTIYGVCPDKKIEEVGQVGTPSLWAFAQDCSAPELTLTSVVHNDCFGELNGAISVGQTGGISPFTYLWSNGATTKDINNLPAGSYTLTVTGSLGGEEVLGPITVTQPIAPLSTNLLSATNAGCNGIGGTAQVGAVGGTSGYTYLWSNGFPSSSQFNMAPGTYSVTTTDANGCTHELGGIVIEPPVLPQAFAASPNEIDCMSTEVYLSGAGSTQGATVSYTWSTTNGNIVSGETTLNQCLVDAPGDYTLLIIDNLTSCQTSAMTSTVANINLPSANAGDPGYLDCNSTEATLSGSASGGANLEYLWTTTNGNIVSGATTLEPVVDDEGDYTLTVTNTDNGCTETSDTEVIEDTAAPNSSATGAEINCINTSVTLEGNSTTAGVTYEWSGPGGFSSTNQNVTVSTSGTYTLVVTDGDNGCTSETTAEATENTTPPSASATGGEITCNNSEVIIVGNSTTSGVTYGWTGPGNFQSAEQSPEVSAPGNYNLTVTAPNGCTETAVAVLGENTTAPTASAGSNEALNCNATSLVLNGAASSSGSQYNYLWTTSNGNIVSGETTTTPTIDEAGTYAILVTNTDNGCTSTASADVTQTPPVETEIASQTNVSCYGGAEGAAEVSATGGNGAFTYAWSTGATTASVSNLSAGTYTVVVTDGEDCSQTETVTITEPAELTLMASATAQTAPGVNDGTATASANGGSGILSYLWNNGETTATITDLAPGNYTVEVTDVNGCVETQTVTVNEFGCAVSADISANGVSCFGMEDGTANIVLNNASAPITYEWSNEATTAEISDLAPGTYSVTASDGNGCEVVASAEVGEPAELNPNTTSTAVTAPGAEDGTATANPTGGTSPFTYEWSNGETTATITDLPSANYTVVVTDANGCTSEQTVPVAPANCAILANITSNNVTCNGAADGTATVTLNNGLSPFTYDWSNGETTATVVDLMPGVYTVEVIDAVGCGTTTEVEINEPEMLEGDVVSLTNADCGMANGAATVGAQGGTQGYEYLWSNGESGASQTDLEAGHYTVEVTDANGCQTEVELEISVDDNEAPMVVTQDISVEITGGGMVEISAEDVDGGSTDNCNIASMEIDVSSFDCTVLGAQEVILTVTDGAGNSSSETAIVTVLDEMAPQVGVQNVTLGLDVNGQATLAPSLINNGSFDNCEIAEMTVDIAEFDCDDLGDNAVVLTVTDAAGNSSSGTAIVTIVDEVAPVASCPSNMTLAYCEPVAEYDVTVEENCDGPLTYQWTHESGSSFPTGLTDVEVVVADESGNTGTCSFTITVPEAMHVDMEMEGISCAGAADGVLTANVSGGASGYAYLWNTGETTPTIEGVSAGVYSLEIMDAAGCSEIFEITVDEPTEIEAEAEIQPETNMQANGSVDVTISGGTAGYSFEWTDSDGDVVSTDEDLVDVPAGTYTLLVTDANGCTFEREYTVDMVSATIDEEIAAKINLFPNPTTGKVMLTFEDVNATEASIFSYALTGQVVVNSDSANISSGAFELDFSEQPSGVYFVKILINNRLVTKRVMVSK